MEILSAGASSFMWMDRQTDTQADGKTWQN